MSTTRNGMVWLFRKQLLISRVVGAGRWTANHFAHRDQEHFRLASTSTSTSTSTSAPTPTLTPNPTPTPTTPTTPKILRRGGPYSAEEDELVRLRRQQGVAWKSIAAELGVASVDSAKARYRWLQKHENAKSHAKIQYNVCASWTPWLQAEKDLLIERYNAGARIVDIAHEIKRTPVSIEKAVERLSCESPNPIKRRRAVLRPFTTVEIARAMLLRSEGAAYQDIATKLGRSRAGLREAISRHEVVADFRGRYSTWSPDEDAKLFNLLQTGLERKDISAHLQRSPMAIRSRLHQLKKIHAQDGPIDWYMSVSYDDLCQRDTVPVPQEPKQ